MKLRSISCLAAMALLAATVVMPAGAQGTAKGGDKVARAGDKAVAKSARKQVTVAQAIVVSREVLVANGYQVVGVTPSGTSQVIYYRRGNMGNGRGLGPVEKIVVVPAGDVVRFQSVPQPMLVTILSRLGL